MEVFSFTSGERELFAKREILPPSRWAPRNIIVQDGLYAGSPVRMDVSPYMPGLLDFYAQPGLEELIICGSLQIGKTLILNICLGWAMDYRPGTKMLAMPTKETRDRVKKDKLVPLMKGSPTLRRQVAHIRTDNIALKNGTHIWLSTAESPSQRASITVNELFLDEEDLYGASGSGNAVEDFKGRTRSLAGRAKILRVSQPKGDESSSIWQGITHADQLYCYEVKCPACLRYHLPDLNNILAMEGEKDPNAILRKKLARYQCPKCKWQWSDHIRDLAVAGGRWMPYSWSDECGFEPSASPVPLPRVAGCHVPAILARSVSLSHLLAKKILADRAEDPRLKTQFANDELGLPYTPVELVTDDKRILTLREAWLPPLAVPNGAVALTCGIDMQKRGFWYLVRAWMPSLASYIIDYGSLETWDDVYKLVHETYYPVLASGGMQGWQPDSAIAPECLTGEMMPIWRAGLDTGGTETEGVFTRTEEAYMWIRANGGGVVHATKGASHGQTANVRLVRRERMPHNGRPIPGGLPLYMLDSGNIKTIEFSRMLNPENTQPTHLHAGCGQDLAEQLSSEQQVRKAGKLVWVNKGGANHLLDCLMLSGACADATFTPSLPLYVLQLKLARREAAAPKPAQKKRERPQRESRWC